MKAKSETLEKFREFKALVENQSSRKIRALRLDNGGEYISGEFNDFCRKAGIKRELLLTTLSRMGLRKGRTKQYARLLEP